MLTKHRAEGAALVCMLARLPAQHFASIAGGLRGFKGRHQLAVVCARMGRHQEAERMWHQVLDEAPRFVPGLAELANLLLHLGRGHEAEGLLARLEALPPQRPALAAKLRARSA
jgi:tetratricopeptide (TPR) repeat protein